MSMTKAQTTKADNTVSRIFDSIEKRADARMMRNEGRDSPFVNYERAGVMTFVKSDIAYEVVISYRRYTDNKEDT